MGRKLAPSPGRWWRGKNVRLEFDVQRKDKYKRTLAYVYIGELMLNAELVRQGCAQVSTFPPNVRYQELFMTLQREAREAQRGLWRP
jgi:micrococcal nuclease